MADQDAAASQDPVDPQGAGAPVPTPDPAPQPEAKADNEVADDALTAAQKVVEDISREVAGATAAGDGSPMELPAFPLHAGGVSAETIDLLADVSLNVKIELGRTSMLLEDVLKLGEGAVVELDKLAGDPVDIYVNNRPVARGEVLVVNDNFCVRVHEILSDSGSSKPPASRASR